MDVDWSENDVFTDEELALAQRIKDALCRVGVRCRGRSSRNSVFTYGIIGFIVPSDRHGPLRINFRAINANSGGEALVGPETPVTEMLMTGDGEITQDFYQEIVAAVGEFKQAMESI